MERNTPEQSKERRILVTDGGSESNDSDSAEEAESSDEQQSASDETEQSESGDDEQAEGEGDSEGDESQESSEDEEGVTVLHLDLQGLFLNVLGLEVDLNEVVLDIDAVPGSGNLLGNLLSGVSGLLDMDMGSLTSMIPLIGGDGEEGEEDGGSVLSGMGDSVSSKASDITDDIPLEDLVSQLITELVSQLLDSSGDSTGQAEDDGGEEAEASA